MCLINTIKYLKMKVNIAEWSIRFVENADELNKFGCQIRVQYTKVHSKLNTLKLDHKTI